MRSTSQLINWTPIQKPENFPKIFTYVLYSITKFYQQNSSQSTKRLQLQLFHFPRKNLLFQSVVGLSNHLYFSKS